MRPTEETCDVVNQPKKEPPLLLSAEEAAELTGVSRSSWWNLNSREKCPAPIHLGGLTKWRRDELIAWIDAGCPNRDSFNYQPQRSGSSVRNGR